MANPNIIPILFEPGIQRDGTQYNGKSCIDGQWVRFTLEQGILGAVPNKIGGYEIIDRGDGQIIRTLFNVPKSNSVDTYIGRNNSLKYQHFTFNGVGSGEVNRTPANYLATYYDPNNLWDFDLFSNVADPNDPLIVAHVAPNANDVANSIEGPIYFGDTVGAGQNLPLEQIVDEHNVPILASGGIVYLAPILIAFSNNGLLRWSDPGVVNHWHTANFQNIANTKIINMVNYRGLLAWTVNSLISLTYTKNDTEPQASFSVTTIESNITVMSPRSIVAYQQQFFWVGIDQFYFFNGVVQRLKNTMSTDWFFKNINFEQRSKVWGMVIPGQREIWWFYPRGDATECTHVVIYNMELNCWYDSEIGRAAGISPGGNFPLPMMTDTQSLRIITRTGFINVYPLWMHEIGYDKVIDPNTLSSIDSYFEAPIFDLFNGDAKSNRLIRTRRIEPNFLLNQREDGTSGTMTVTIRNRMFPSDTTINGKLIESGPYTFDANTQKVDNINSQGRLVSLLFRSNEVGGSYKMGKTLLNYDIGDVQP